MCHTISEMAFFVFFTGPLCTLTAYHIIPIFPLPFSSNMLEDLKDYF
jgi:hypothetical protein